MRQRNTFVALFFIVATLLSAWVLNLAVQTLFASLKMTNTGVAFDGAVAISHLIGAAVGLVVGGICFAHPKTKRLVGEVLDELNKVNWPSWAETKMNTLVVIVTSVIAAAILGVFDITFGWASDWLAGLRF